MTGGHGAGFAERVKEANSSALGVRNGGAMLSAQVRLTRIALRAMYRIQQHDHVLQSC